MADERDDSERSEDPTQKRLDEALERGDVAKSQEVNTWFVIAAATLILMVFSAPMGHGITTTLRGLIANSYAIRVDGRGFLGVVSKLGFEVIAAVALPLLLLALAAIAGNLVQHRLVWSPEGLKPKLSKISPAAGLKKLFSKQALANFAKGLVKLALIGTIITLLLWQQRYRLDSLVATDPAAILPLTQTLSLEMLGTVVAVLALDRRGGLLLPISPMVRAAENVAARAQGRVQADRWRSGDQGQDRQIRQERARKRMMAAVPSASVVITNPTHYAVALKYDRGMNAPICVAKGVDVIARRIREVAAEHAIPVVENPPLARALHGTVEIDQEIPSEHYQAVAEIIGYVMRLNRAVGGRN